MESKKVYLIRIKILTYASLVNGIICLLLKSLKNSYHFPLENIHN